MFLKRCRTMASCRCVYSMYTSASLASLAYKFWVLSGSTCSLNTPTLTGASGNCRDSPDKKKSRGIQKEMQETQENTVDTAGHFATDSRYMYHVTTKKRRRLHRLQLIVKIFCILKYVESTINYKNRGCTTHYRDDIIEIVIPLTPPLSTTVSILLAIADPRNQTRIPWRPHSSIFRMQKRDEFQW